MRTTPTSPLILFLSRVLSQSLSWVWSVAVLSIIVFCTLAWLFVQQHRTLELTLSELENFRQARINLSNGFLQVSLSDYPNSPFGKAEGYVLLQEAASSFNQSLSRLGITNKNSTADFERSVKRFEEHLSQWKEKGMTQTDETVNLRFAFDDLERNAGVMDLKTHNNLTELTKKIDRKFAIVLCIAVMLLSVICIVVFYAGKIRDRFENASKESESRLRFALEGTNDGLWDLQLKTGKSYLSPRGCEMLGYQPDEMEKTVVIWSDLIHPEDLPKTRECLQDHIDGRAPIIQAEQRMRMKSGDWKWILSRGKVVSRDENGTPLRATGTHTDISERKKLENQLQQAQKMEAVGRLAGGVAHDFNNMLGVILGNVDMAMEAIESGESPLTELSEINKAAEHSVELTRQLLAFARRQTIAPEVLDLNSAVKGMLTMLRRLIGENIDLAWHPCPGIWPVKVDPAQVNQLLANLCVNARDAIENIGCLTIETGNTTFDDCYCSFHEGFVPGDYVLIAVSDNGFGMTKETLNQIFEPFFTTKGMGKGTGLGLATIYGAVKQNKGFINVYSEPGMGTTFKIYFPRHGTAAADSKKIDISSKIPSGRGETILLVEDEPTLLKLATKILSAYGYNVLHTNSPSEAIRMAEELPRSIDLLISDVVMPEMNCKDLSDQIKAFRPDIPCLFMSGYTANVIAHHGVLDEGVQFIQKPFSKKELAVKVRAVIDRQRETLNYEQAR
ncbi:MAG: PAS domain-containing protein [Desulfobacteraceae bacterium]|jgi:PAS domain S-box-containing protein